jgi:DNA topoisomerase I
MKDYLKELQIHEKKFNKNSSIAPHEETVTYGLAKKEDIKEAQNNVETKKPPEEKPSIFIKKFPGTKDKTVSTIKKLEEAIEKEEKKLLKKEENKSIALGTSKINYNDPRISVAWCKNNEVPIEKVFPKALRFH